MYKLRYLEKTSPIGSYRVHAEVISCGVNTWGEAYEDSIQCCVVECKLVNVAAVVRLIVREVGSLSGELDG